MLNIGPAIVAVTAISPNPFLVIATSADISPRQFPHDSTVNERRAYGNLVINPKIFTKSTTHPDEKLIHAILCKKAKNEYTVNKKFGAYDLLVYFYIQIPRIAPGTIKPRLIQR